MRYKKRDHDFKVQRYDKALAGDVDSLIEIFTERGLKFTFSPEDDKKLAQVLITMGLNLDGSERSESLK